MWQKSSALYQARTRSARDGPRSLCCLGARCDGARLCAILFLARRCSVASGGSPAPSTMLTDERMALLTAVQSANPANEAEVETKLLLHIFRLLGYTDTDRADKRPVTMSFGRERKTKAADFIIYDGSDRTAANALIAVEAKSPGEPLADAEDQVKSYALWAGTPFYMACNGEELLVATFLPGADASQRRTFRIPELLRDWNILEGLLSRSAVVLEKERLVYKAFYLPGVETLPASDFFREYLERLQSRFTALHTELRRRKQINVSTGNDG